MPDLASNCLLLLGLFRRMPEQYIAIGHTFQFIAYTLFMTVCPSHLTMLKYNREIPLRLYEELQRQNVSCWQNSHFCWWFQSQRGSVEIWSHFNFTDGGPFVQESECILVSAIAYGPKHPCSGEMRAGSSLCSRFQDFRSIPCSS